MSHFEVLISVVMMILIGEGHVGQSLDGGGRVEIVKSFKKPLTFKNPLCVCLIFGTLKHHF